MQYVAYNRVLYARQLLAQGMGAAEAAREGGYDYFATTLTVSPHKNAPLINAIGEKLAEDHGVLWLPSDFKKRDGYRRSIELSHEYGLYRQSWCGCGLPENF